MCSTMSRFVRICKRSTEVTRRLGKKTKEKRKECGIEKHGMTRLGDPRRITRLTVDCSQHAMGYIQQAHLLSGAM